MARASTIIPPPFSATQSTQRIVELDRRLKALAAETKQLREAKRISPRCGKIARASRMIPSLMKSFDWVVKPAWFAEVGRKAGVPVLDTDMLTIIQR